MESVVKTELQNKQLNAIHVSKNIVKLVFPGIETSNFYRTTGSCGCVNA